MNNYPIRKHGSPEEYVKQYSSGWAWSYINDLYSGKFATTFPPGGVQFVSLSISVVIPSASIIIFLMLAVFDAKSPAFKGILLMIGAGVTTVIHVGFMMRVPLGYRYGQQDLVRYLAVLLAVSLCFLVYGLMNGAPFKFVGLTIIGSAIAALMYWLGRSLGFTKYADLMRAKRLYLLQLKSQKRKR